MELCHTNLRSPVFIAARLPCRSGCLLVRRRCGLLSWAIIPPEGRDRTAIIAHDGRTDAHGHDEQLPGAGPGGRERPGAPGPLRRRAAGAGGGPPLPQRPGPDAGHALLGPAPALRGGQDGAAEGGLRRRRARRRRGGYLGRRFRPDRPGRHAAGQPGPLSRRADRRHARSGVPARPARADLRDHRPAIPAVQHALSAPGAGAVELAAPRGRPRRC